MFICCRELIVLSAVKSSVRQQARWAHTAALIFFFDTVIFSQTLTRRQRCVCLRPSLLLVSCWLPPERC